MPVTVTVSNPISFEVLSDKIARTAALNSVGLISQRVQNQGKNASGEQMVSKSEKKTGAYSRGWGNKRVKFGRQVSIIDLTFSGAMIDSFTFSPEGKNYVVGFSSDEQGKIAGYNEDEFGVIFNLSDSENDLVSSIIQDSLNEHFK